jgi:hypothetical protein
VNLHDQNPRETMPVAAVLCALQIVRP